MITVAQAVFQQLQRDELALESLKSGLLNFSAYADQVQNSIEKATFKKVKRGTIIVSLSRIAKTIPSTPPLKPKIIIENIAVKAPLIMLTFDKTMDIKRRIATMNPFLVSTEDLPFMVEGASEVNLFINARVEKRIIGHMGKPKKQKINLVAVTASLDRKKAHTENFFYGIFASFAPKRMQIEEVISTSTELSFIIKKGDMEEAVKTLNLFSLSTVGL